MNLHVHYEAAFEDYLKTKDIPYVGVDEHRRAMLAGAHVKSFDFIVYRPNVTWLVDIKGRKFPYEIAPGLRYWENWVTDEDIAGLTTWRETLGEGFEARLIFAYWLLRPAYRLPIHCVHTFREQYYAFLCVPLEEYKKHCRRRSDRWGTMTVPVRIFRELAVPIQAA